MGNVVEFFVKMKDMMSGGLVRMGQTAQNAFTRVQQQVDRVGQRNRALGMSFDELSKKIRDVEATIARSTVPKQIAAAKKELAELQRMQAKHPGNINSGSGGGGMLAGFGKKLLGIAATAGIMAFAQDSVGAAMDYGATTKSFEVLTGSKERGRGLAGELRDLKQNTILGTAVYGNAQTLMGFGISDKEVIKDLKMLGDVSMGNTERFGQLSLVFAQTRAAGKLMGQDLLQYINAGFNPLGVMAEKWQQFGFKQKVTVGQLKQLMEKGAISAGMVTKAFEVATGAGGKFNNMMEQIAQTSFGKLQMLKGHFAAFKIDVGNALLPIADELMNAASKTLEWLNISKTVPQTLMGERAEINTLVNSITGLNEGNEMRDRLIGQLNAKYPDFLKNLGTEHLSNSDLLDTLDKVNLAYEKRIRLASGQLAYDTTNKLLADSQNELLYNTSILNAIKNNDRLTVDAVKRPSDKFTDFLGSNNQEYQKYLSRVTQIEGQIKKISGVNSTNKDNLDILSLQAQIDDANKLAGDKDAMKKQFGGKDGKRRQAEFLKELDNATGLSKMFDGGIISGSQFLANAGSKLKGMMSPSSIAGNSGAGATTTTKQPGEIGRSIASGGPRIININGVKFTDKVEIHAQTVEQGIDNLEQKMMEMFLRVLNSGAAVQDHG